MAIDTRSLLVGALVDAMRLLGKEGAAALASEVTSLVNGSIGNSVAGSSDAKTKALAARLMPKELRNLGTLTLGWEAYRHWADGAQGESPLSPGTQVVCSIPGGFVAEAELSAELRSTGIWPGSLVASLYGMFDRVARELQVISPYWSSNGIEVLLRHISRKDFTGVSVRVLTQPPQELSEDEHGAVSEFRHFMMSRGSTVDIVSPVSRNGRVFLVHAKAVVQDRATAYIGSANLTLNGIENSVEVGAVLHGAQALQLSRWLDIIASGMESWD